MEIGVFFVSKGYEKFCRRILFPDKTYSLGLASVRDLDCLGKERDLLGDVVMLEYITI